MFSVDEMGLEDEKLVHKVRVRLPGRGHQQPEGDFPVISRENILPICISYRHWWEETIEIDSITSPMQFNSIQKVPLEPYLVVISKGDLYFVSQSNVTLKKSIFSS